MSAFLMSVESTSQLAHNLWDKGRFNTDLQEFFDSVDITCAEDLFLELRKANMKSLTARYGDKFKKSDVGEYCFDNDKLSLPALYKRIMCWEYQSCESAAVCKSKLYKVLIKFADSIARKFITDSEEYQEAAWE